MDINEKGRPIITGSDHPATVDRALRASMGFWRRTEPNDAVWLNHRMQNAYETLEDDFIIHGDLPPLEPEASSTLLDLSPRLLETTLVAYGHDLLDAKELDENELNKVDHLLKEIDSIK